MSLNRIADGLSRTFELIAETALVVLLLLVAHEVFLRYVFNAPTQYSVELSEYLLVLLSFFSIAYVLQRDRHVRVTFVRELLPPRGRAAADLVAYALLVGYGAVLIYYGGEMSLTAFQGDDRSSSLVSFPLFIPYALIPLGALALALQAAVQVADAVRRLRAGARRTSEKG
jgi:TRAP-type C4-dicarboxylate transport system permease small subunit